jgi:hypothetical protein
MSEKAAWLQHIKQERRRERLQADLNDLEDFLELVNDLPATKSPRRGNVAGLGPWAQRGKRPRKPTSRGKAYGRTKLTNGKDRLPDVDGRCLLYKRFREIARLVAADQGGLDALSEARVQLVRRFAATCVMAEQLEANMCNGLEIDINQHTALSSTLVRLGARIGIDRRAKHITPNLTDYLELQSAPERGEPAPNAPVSKGDDD